MGTSYIDPQVAAACDEAADIADGRDTVDDVQQQVYDGPAIPVRIADPVAVQPLPSRAGSTESRTVDDVTPVKLCTADPRRSRLLISSDAVVYVAPLAEDARSRTRAFRLPANQAVPFHAQDMWYAVADTGTAEVSVLTEQWAR